MSPSPVGFSQGTGLICPGPSLVPGLLTPLERARRPAVSGGLVTRRLGLVTIVHEAGVFWLDLGKIKRYGDFVVLEALPGIDWKH